MGAPVYVKWESTWPRWCDCFLILRTLQFLVIAKMYPKCHLQTADCFGLVSMVLTHWGRVTHICVGELSIMGSDNSLSPGRRQAIIWTNDGISIIGPLGTNFSDILIGIQTFSFDKLHLKTSFAKWRLLCLGLNELIYGIYCVKTTQKLPQSLTSRISVVCRLVRLG